MMEISSVSGGKKKFGASLGESRSSRKKNKESSPKGERALQVGTASALVADASPRTWRKYSDGRLRQFSAFG